jgi:hypothetical protein
MSEPVDLYDMTYRHFDEPVLARVRREAFGEDIGQNSWLTADECRTYCQWLRLGQRRTCSRSAAARVVPRSSLRARLGRA